MKIRLLLFGMFFTVVNLFSQITVLDSDVVDIGDNVYEALDSVSRENIQIGASGPNQTWDFSNLQTNQVNVTQYFDQNST